jgi:RNA polymerase sigma-70 factor (ECF subfamily)
MKSSDAFSTQTLRDFSQIDLALNGSQQAYHALFKRYWRQLFFAVHKMVPDQEEARDVTIEAFTNLHRFRKEYGFNTWLYRIAINHSLDHKRKKRLSTTPLSTFASDDANDYFTLGNDHDRGNADPEEQVIRGQKAQAIHSRLGALPSQYREVARLRFVDAYSYVEIADQLQMPMGTVKARCLLRQSLLSLRN